MDCYSQHRVYIMSYGVLMISLNVVLEFVTALLEYINLLSCIGKCKFLNLRGLSPSVT